ncbi:hypothetical protein C8R41DRAFT_304985 [Lentinula lateritia]|uniref:Uncharacterized protein n=1 Tax=Lentinula lateritia TaxID=40482 RepID=A0ABQ8VHM1_9AGAR|nr:hypothetical protein C8R41DRAFT_304985 [Lentinula lateritia]
MMRSKVFNVRSSGELRNNRKPGHTFPGFISSTSKSQVPAGHFFAVTGDDGEYSICNSSPSSLNCSGWSIPFLELFRLARKHICTCTLLKEILDLHGQLFTFSFGYNCPMVFLCFIDHGQPLVTQTLITKVIDLRYRPGIALTRPLQVTVPPPYHQAFEMM